MMKRIAVLSMLAVALMAGAARADMTYAPFCFGTALGASGSPIANGTYVMVLDLDNDGFNGKSYVTAAGLGSEWQWDADDLIMDRGQIVAGEAYPFAIVGASGIAKPATYTANVDHYYFLWFDVAYSASASGPGTGVHYGAEDLGTVGAADPGNYGEFIAGGAAMLTTAVPEPMTMSLLGLGLGGLWAARRRNHNRKA